MIIVYWNSSANSCNAVNHWKFKWKAIARVWSIDCKRAWPIVFWSNCLHGLSLHGMFTDLSEISWRGVTSITNLQSICRTRAQVTRVGRGDWTYVIIPLDIVRKRATVLWTDSWAWRQTASTPIEIISNVMYGIWRRIDEGGNIRKQVIA